MRDESRKGKTRVVEPQRRQGVIRFEMPEDKLAPTHTARLLCDVIGALDLTSFLDGLKAIEGTVGRKTLSPQMKLTLWLYAISNGVGSAREIARLIASDDGYRWPVDRRRSGSRPPHVVSVPRQPRRCARTADDGHPRIADAQRRFVARAGCAGWHPHSRGGDGSVVSPPRVVARVPRASGAAPQGDAGERRRP